MQKRLVILARWFVRAATGAPAWALWGCGSNSFAFFGDHRTWGMSRRVLRLAMKSLFLSQFPLLFAITATAQPNESSSGSGIGGGDILTNSRVVKACGHLVGGQSVTLSAAAKARPQVVALPRIAIQPGTTRGMLYEEDPRDTAGKSSQGTVVWRTETFSLGTSRPDEVMVCADIRIPDRKMKIKWSLLRNDDKSLPVSHTIEVALALPPNFPHVGVQNVPGFLMKESEQARGVPLLSFSIKVTAGYFVIGLSAVDAEMQRNVALLKNGPWFAVPIVYNDGRRAILAVEKGVPGERVFNDAFAAWEH
jgi:hypothetical protein